MNKNVPSPQYQPHVYIDNAMPTLSVVQFTKGAAMTWSNANEKETELFRASVMER